MDAYARLNRITASAASTVDTKGLRERCFDAMNDDLNSPIVISHLFDASKSINLVSDGKETINADDLKELKAVFDLFIVEILGLGLDDKSSQTTGEGYKGAIDLLLNMRMEAKANKDWATSDKIRNELTALGFEIKDTKEGFEWKLVK